MLKLSPTSDSTIVITLAVAGSGLLLSPVLRGLPQAWGNIPGVLNDQVDLKAALDLKAPLASPSFTGAINVAGATFSGPMNVAGGALTASTPSLNVSQTWNAAAVAFTADKLNITDTASAAGSLLLDRQVNGVSVFSVRKDGGLVTLGGSTSLFPALRKSGIGVGVDIVSGDASAWANLHSDNLVLESGNITLGSPAAGLLKVAGNLSASGRTLLAGAVDDGVTALQVNGNVSAVKFNGAGSVNLGDAIFSGFTAVAGRGLLTLQHQAASAGQSLVSVATGTAVTGNITMLDGVGNATAISNIRSYNPNSATGSAVFTALISATSTGNAYSEYTQNGAQTWQAGYHQADAGKFKISASAFGGAFDWLSIDPTTGLTSVAAALQVQQISGPGNQFATLVVGGSDGIAPVVSLGGTAGEGVTVRGSGWFAFSGSDALHRLKDVVLVRDAANTLAQRNGLNAQTFNLYRTYTDASNYERGFAGWVGGNSLLYRIGTQAAGTGIGREMEIGTEGVANLNFRTSGAYRWRLDYVGHLAALADNVFDFGQFADASFGRARNIYAGTSVNAPQLKVTALATPAAPTGTGSATGGTLAAATYYGKVVALDINGSVTNAGAESVGVVLAGTTSSIAWTWPAVAGAASYQLWYGTAAGAEGNYYTSSTNSFTQTAAAGTAGTIPTVNTSGSLVVNASNFKVSATGAATVFGTLNIPSNGSNPTITISPSGALVYSIIDMQSGAGVGSGMLLQAGPSAGYIGADTITLRSKASVIYAVASSTGLAVTGKISTTSADGSNIALLAGATKALRITPTATNIEIASTDQTGAVSYQPLSLNGSGVSISIYSSIIASVSSSGLGVTGNLSASGRTLLGGATDDGVTALQVNGAGKFSGAITASSTISMTNGGGTVTLASYNSGIPKLTFGAANTDTEVLGGQIIVPKVSGNILRGANWTQTQIALDAPNLVYRPTGESGQALSAHRFTTLNPLIIAGSNIATFDNGAGPLVTIDKSGAIYSYNSYTDASNYERLTIKSTGSSFLLFSDQAGTGFARALQIGTTGGADVSIFTGNVNTWDFKSAGHLLTRTDNTYDIGSATLRPRTGYFGASIVTPDLYLNNAGYVRAKTFAGVATRLFGLTATDSLYIGGVDTSIVSLTFLTNGTIGSWDSTALSVTGTIKASGNLSLLANGTSGKYIGLLAEGNTYAGKLIMQAGGGSTGFGGAINLYGHSHAAHPGDVVAAISSGSGGKFRVNNGGLDDGIDYLVSSSTGLSITGNLSASGRTLLAGATDDGVTALQVNGATRITGVITASSGLTTTGQTVASLPADVDGTRRFVTDATVAYTSANVGTTVVGGGTNPTPVIRVAGLWKIG